VGREFAFTSTWFDSNENILKEVLQFLEIVMIFRKPEVALVSDIQYVRWNFYKISACDPGLIVKGRICRDK